MDHIDERLNGIDRLEKRMSRIVGIRRVEGVLDTVFAINLRNFFGLRCYPRIQFMFTGLTCPNIDLSLQALPR